MRFPDLETIVALAETEYEREFLRSEFAPGLEYYVARVDRLLFRGRRVLDAGCGAGQWSLALAQRFENVDAVDLNKQRLGVLRAVAERMGVANVRPCHGSLENLPYGDGTFDAVFCYGVIMLTYVERTLAELHRVLRPGGRLYLCLNADGWSHLLAERGDRSSAQTADGSVNPGLATLYTTYWRRALRQGLKDALDEGAKDYPEGLLPWEDRLLFKVQRRLRRWFRRSMAVLGGQDWKRSLARDALCRSSVGRELFRRVRGFCGEGFVPLLLDDVAVFLETGTPPLRFGPTRAVRPEEMRELATAIGFADFQWSVEAGLACDWTCAVEPKYDGYYKDHLSVWECLLVKPDRAFVPVALERHFQAARQAALNPVYVEDSRDPVLSNASCSTYPLPLLHLAQQQSAALGGPCYMKRLAQAVVAGESDGEEAVRRIIRFVQKAVFRDPVAQPMLDDGSLPDGLTTLLCARGRCGHAARILVELFHAAGFDARLRQFPRHVVAEVRCGDRWVIADADAFKGGIIPENAEGHLLSMEEIEADPYLLDRYPPIGWMTRPGCGHTKGVFGFPVRGYVDALEPEQRGFVSGYYVPRAAGFPPSLPEILRFETMGGRFVLSWSASHVREGRLLSYRVRVGTRSRGWTYDNVFLAEAPLAETSADVLCTETTELCVEGPIPSGTKRLYASVVAVSDRVALEPSTYFWPSEEASCDMP